MGALKAREYANMDRDRDENNTYLNPPTEKESTELVCTCCKEKYFPALRTIENDLNGTWHCSDCLRELSDASDAFTIVTEHISWHISFMFEDDPHRQGIDLEAVTALREKMIKTFDRMVNQAKAMGGVK